MHVDMARSPSSLGAGSRKSLAACHQCRRAAGDGLVAVLTAFGALLVLAASACENTKPDGAGLVFTRYANAEKSSVWVADADGSDARRIAPDAYNGSLSPDGRRLAYLVPAGDPDAFPTLFVREVAGGQPRPVGKAFKYAWSPDGMRLAASSLEALFVFDLSSGKRRKLVSGRVLGGFSFAPEGHAVAYGRWNGRAGREYRSDIFVLRISDGRITRLTHDRHSDEPVWGRSWIVYRRFHFDGEWSIGRLRLMRPDGSGDRMLARGDERTSLARMGLSPLELSEDGKRLLACAAAEFHCAPVTLAVPGGTDYNLPIRALVRRGELAYVADLAPDGSEVLFDVGPFDGPTGHRVYAIPFEGGKPRLLVRDATDASWAR
jgi:hypothetical protein